MTKPYPNTDDLSTEDYIVLGLATCFYKEDGEIHEIEVIEPIPSAALEAICKGIPTSYRFAVATTLGAVFDQNQLLLPQEFPETAQFGDEFVLRLFSAARTYKRRETAQNLIPLGTTKTDLNYSTERKRVLNASRVVTKEDNIKQHSHTHKVL
ncbi:hypothetical protein H6F32_00955 [Anabaena sp. FACHB-1237]|uniref:hypothetical protein n=1 Tax=Anabaena sp. FACHB-1237 TaxID=2692769 RepID=UPI0016801F6F|nr:hypothetical protein [Anabaena sp. FACHB-1237]MBD2136180.1 hypothetical protein [Anabaena sp. FACHB-1237]